MKKHRIQSWNPSYGLRLDDNDVMYLRELLTEHSDHPVARSILTEMENAIKRTWERLTNE